MLDIDLDAVSMLHNQRAVEQLGRELAGSAMYGAMQKATLLVTRDAKKLAPVDTGRLRASITPGVDADKDGVYGVVGSNVEYAPYVELGTRRMKARRFLQRAFEQNLDRIKRLLGDGVSAAINKVTK